MRSPLLIEAISMYLWNINV